MTLLGIDLGTTHLKAGLFALDGQALKIVARPNQARPGWEGVLSYDPEELWSSVIALLIELNTWVKEHPNEAGPLQAVGIAGMAETGLLIDARSGRPRTPFIPWFETCATAQAEALARQFDPEERFFATGLRLGYKFGLMKLLWLQARHPELIRGGVWLAAPDFVAYRLTGALATDYTLAERTAAFRIAMKGFDSLFLESVNLPGELFPAPYPSGTVVGESLPFSDAFGLPAGVPVSIAGHDHVCGAFAAARLASSGQGPLVFDSIGTAEALIGEFPERELGPADLHSGFAFGLSASPGQLYWQGGLSTSGGSLEWLRRILSEDALTYAALDVLVQSRGDTPTGIFYFPFLAGSGSPHSNSRARGAFIGLHAGHSRADLAQAVLEGCAYELEWMRRKAEAVVAQPIGRVSVAGGGTRNRCWLQTKTDVYGCPVDVIAQEETTLLGAALLAGLGCGVYPNLPALETYLAACEKITLLPDPARSAVYRRLFEDGYSKIEPLIQHIKLPQ